MTFHDAASDGPAQGPSLSTVQEHLVGLTQIRIYRQLGPHAWHTTRTLAAILTNDGIGE
ncbi:MAG TPA: hypothetical protein VFC19_10705 [Candidatus Limnocylindrales bacterium]|nr:hypothetical protein [Candidatus Limnocylindrales bacterium]